MIDEAPRLLPPEDCERVLRAVIQLSRQTRENDDIQSPTLFSWWNSELRWARNAIVLASGRRDIRLTTGATTNQTDTVSLQGLIEADKNKAEFQQRFQFENLELTAPRFAAPKTLVWSDRTFDADLGRRTQFLHALCDAAHEKGMLSAGYLEMRGGRVATIDLERDRLHISDFTQAQCSLTVRHPKGVGSGWAGLSSYDWASIDAEAIAKQALEKCLASINPVAIEPGRYTTILEPDAVLGLTDMLSFDRLGSEKPPPTTPWWLEWDAELQMGRSKLGLQVVDERITIEHDPIDPLLGVLPAPALGPVKWITNGVLTELDIARSDALEFLNENSPTLGRFAYRISGGTVTKETMIENTERGLLVTRFSNVTVLDMVTRLCTGLTRDGLWLIERGKITKAVKNMRFTESPVFVLNQIAELGVPTRTFRPARNPNVPLVGGAIVPVMRVRDFSFTSMVDAI